MVHFDESKRGKQFSNERFLKLEGYLTEKDAKETLADFLHCNLGFTVKLLTGIELFPYQEIILRAWFDNNFNMNVISRGGSKSFLCAIFSAIYPIFYPNTRIVLTSNSFRATRRVITSIENIINGKKATLLKQCYVGNKAKLEFRRAADEMLMTLPNGSTISALPLNEKIRGTRGDVLFCDEFLQIPEDIYEFVLKPFLTAKNNITEQLEIKEIEDDLIKKGIIEEEDRTVLPSNKKIIAMTSASYDFEFAYRLYSQWVDKILDPSKKIKDEEDFEDEKEKRTYFACRLSYKALPDELVEKEIIEEAKSGGENSPAFQREYMAIFSSSSDGFFNIKRLHENTARHGEFPHVQLKGNKDSKYILAIDPNFSSSKSSDFFAMGVYLLNDTERTITQVHSYAVPGGKLQDHIKYVFYLMSNFNIVFLAADLSGEGEGFNFIETCNLSSYFSDRNMKLEFIDGDFDKDEVYMEQITKAKNSYNLYTKRIVYRQVFNSTWNRKANEYLQSQIDKGKVKFVSPLFSHEKGLEAAIQGDYRQLFPTNSQKDLTDWIGIQDDLIEQTKSQLALIEVKTTTNGTMQFDLPQHLKRSKSVDRARRDNYSCLLMGTWAAKNYWAFTYDAEVKKTQKMAMPSMAIAKF